MEVLLLGLHFQKDNVTLSCDLRKLLWKLGWNRADTAVVGQQRRPVFPFSFLFPHFEHFPIIADEPASVNLATGAAWWLSSPVSSVPLSPASGSSCRPDPCCHYFRMF